MVDFNYEIDFALNNEEEYSDWIHRIVVKDAKNMGALSYIFCDDKYLNKINLNYLGHDTYTDIITFDYGNGMEISGDIFISVERVRDNAEKYNTEFEVELRRVMSHGVLHLFGHKDKSNEEAKLMRLEEEKAMKMFHVEQ
ncbi:rRNA maturation RNase YbeY [Croceitalea sp. MTPC5]|uniref:rRNA maturation RNase YbeY n=1 Tax=Croceitalea sp. MTPC5 TaxID=3056565 RepID=UPI002B3D74AD|nr:rRNA maturation RNase YbeY [Croceitalea sp. MTPC5]